jgi:hypothetical protein
MITYLQNRREYIQPFAQTLPDYHLLVNRTSTQDTGQKAFWTDDPTLQVLATLLEEVA